MNLQEIKQKLYERFTDGKGQAADRIGDCMYRTPDGNRCAVGCLIPDELYTNEMEQAAMSALVPLMGRWAKEEDVGLFDERSALVVALNTAGIEASKEVRELLVAAQAVHDKHSNWNGNGCLYKSKLEELGLI